MKLVGKRDMWRENRFQDQGPFKSGTRQRKCWDSENVPRQETSGSRQMSLLQTPVANRKAELRVTQEGQIKCEDTGEAFGSEETSQPRAAALGSAGGLL